MNDNTRRPQFVSACERLMGSKLKHLDLGCAGGGLVLDFILRGHFSIGLEGSDYSYLRQRAEWRLLPCNLFTCDITKPFIIRDIDSDEQLTFHVISAWEFMEHIVEEDLPCVLQNVYDHLSTDGLFIGSIATFPEDDSHVGAIYHHTLKPLGWWEEFFGKHGLRFVYDHQFLSQDFVRGVGNGPMDWNAVTNPGMGFHFVARKLVLS
ncbi:MAG: class I SAM-dependent methyltransferase [Deltaproteobacteria bacterium]|nr:class I SAM-dependent methyltransferase [Deltaproteobacteria bacterium]